MQHKRSSDKIHRVTFSEDKLTGVLLLRNFFSYDECDQILKDSAQWKSGPASIYTDSRKQEDHKNTAHIRKGTVHHRPSSDPRDYVNDILDQAVEQYCTLHSHPPILFDDKRYDIEIAEYSDYQDHFDWHQDHRVDGAHLKMFGTRMRKISMSLILSDEGSGCNLQFDLGKNKNYTPGLYKGDIILFPSYVSHRVTPLQSGERKALIVWACGDFWK